MRQEPQSMRLVGGTAAVISALASGLPSASIRLGARATRVALAGQAVEVDFVEAGGTERTVRATQIVLSVPPRFFRAEGPRLRGGGNCGNSRTTSLLRSDQQACQR